MSAVHQSPTSSFQRGKYREGNWLSQSSNSNGVANVVAYIARLRGSVLVSKYPPRLGVANEAEASHNALAPDDDGVDVLS